MNSEKISKWANIAILCAFGLLILRLFGKYLLPCTVPFIIASVIALAVRKLSSLMSYKTHINVKIWSFVLLFVFLSLIIFLTVMIFETLTNEISQFISNLLNDSSSVISVLESIFAYFEKLPEKIPIISRIKKITGNNDTVKYATDMLISAAVRSLTVIGEKIPTFALNIAGNLPNILLFTTVTVISCFYFCLDHKNIRKSVKDILPATLKSRIPVIGEKLSYALKNWIKAYFLIFLLTFAELMIGFFIIGTRYKLLIALLTAAVDILPVFGTGIVLIPWGAYMLITGDIFKGAGLLILYAVITVVRQIAEPHIVGGSFGIHPLITLAALFVGFRTFGFAGMILLPAVTVTVLTVIKNSAVQDKKDTGRDK